MMIDLFLASAFVSVGIFVFFYYLIARGRKEGRMETDLTKNSLMATGRFWRIVDAIDDTLRKEYFGQQIRLQFRSNPQFSDNLLESLKRHYSILGFDIKVQVFSEAGDTVTHIIIN